MHAREGSAELRGSRDFAAIEPYVRAMKPLLTALALAALGCGARQPGSATAGSDIDESLAQEIAKIKAVDNHAHPVRPVAEGQPPDMEFDALLGFLVQRVLSDLLDPILQTRNR